ncbi:L-glutamate gamma-semialdehyde dehydrogenase [soil metagenome]
MSNSFPRVTYANTGVDLTTLHDFLDEEIPRFKAAHLGKHWPNVFGGTPDDSGASYEVHSPIDRKTLLGSFVRSDARAVDRAVAAASQAYPSWSATPWRERVAALLRWADVLEREKYTLALAVLEEVAKSRPEAVGEAEESLDMIRFYCSEMEANNGFVKPMRRAFAQEETVNLLRPMGVFGVISPYNFPLALSVGMMMGSLLTGNTVVFKPSPGCALSGHLLVATMREAGLEKIVGIVTGDDVTGKAIVDHPKIAGIAFTGSHEAGMAIFHAMNKGHHTKPVVAEMGGKNPAYVSRSADIGVAAEGVARSAFGLQGQKCSACSVVYVDNQIKPAFLDALLAYVRTLGIGNPEQRGIFVGPLYDQASDDRFAAALSAAARDGKVLHGGEKVAPAGLEQGFYRQPAVVELPAGHPLVKDELFLPFLVVRGFDDFEAGIAEGNDVMYGLTAGVYTRDEAELSYFLDRAEAGALYANRRSGATTGAWPGIQSFCGWKGSGVSHKGGLGPNYLQQFMREQSHTVMR